MARVRRKATAKTRLNFEIAGIAAIGAAVLLGIALALPSSRAGIVGAPTAQALHVLFGGAAPLFPVLVALFGAIIFLEINVPRMIATLGTAALLYFLLLDSALGRRGGWVGEGVWRALQALVGVLGARIVLGLVAMLAAVWITNVSVKKVIGLLVLALSNLRMPRMPRPQLPKGHGTLREAFALPKRTDLVPVEAFVPPPAPVIVLEDDSDDEPEEEYEIVLPAQPLRPEYGGYVQSMHGEIVYQLPDLALFDPPQAQVADDSSRSHVLEDTLASFGVGAKVVHVERGPSITRYELRPERGVKISRIASLGDDIALALAATSVRIEAPIPGKSAVGIEVPNKTISVVAIREILEALPQRGQVPPLWMALGKDITGRPVFGDLGKMPHLLVAGATGSGKSVCLNTIIASLLVSATPDQVQMLMIDPKRVELTVYNGIPHLIKEVITDARMAAGALFEMTKEMDTRYERFAKAGVRKIEEYNNKYPEEKLPYVVIIIDELADLMLVAPAKVETTIMRLAQLARATGIHLIVATQRPSVDVITGLIKANIPSRIAFAVSSQVDSRTILDMAGAERLLGRGDMLYLPIDAPKPVRSQGALITGSEVHRLVDFWAKQGRPQNLLDVEVVPISDDDSKREVDPLCYEAAKFIIESSYASTASLQSQFSIGHPRAVRVMKQLEDFKIVGPHEGTKPRRILIGLGELEQIAPRLGRVNGGQQDLFAAGAERSSSGVRAMVPSVSSLEIRNVVKTFGKRNVVDSATLSIPRGWISGLAGVNGSGKSTLFKIIAGFLSSEAGDVALAGEPGGTMLTNVSPWDRARLGIRYISQNRRVLHGASSLDNLRIAIANSQAPSRSITAHVLETLEVLRLTFLLNLSPSSMEQRDALWLLVASAYLANPRFLILDEPFAHLTDSDIHHCIAILQRMRDAGTGILITDHHAGALLHCTETMHIMQEGRIVYCATSDEARTSAEAYRLYFRKRA